MDERVIDAYRFPRRVAEGCEHRLGCKCDPPYWLRPPSPDEERRYARPIDWSLGYGISF